MDLALITFSGLKRGSMVKIILSEVVISWLDTFSRTEFQTQSVAGMAQDSHLSGHTKTNDSRVFYQNITIYIRLRI